jgi:HNH endonuclease
MVKSGRIKNCLNCGGEHYVIPAKEKRGGGKYCSISCKAIASKGVESKKKGNIYPHLQKAKVTICATCNKEFRATDDYKGRAAKFCSKECWANRRVLGKCEGCGGDIFSYHGKKYCSKKCASVDMVGEKAARWRDGKSLERDRARDSPLLKAWRKAVFCRDGYACQSCGEKESIQAHHIVEWAKDEGKRFDVGNGLTLCINCHGAVHGRDFTRRNNKKCLTCGTKVRSANTRCRSCATRKQWADKKIGAEILRCHRAQDAEIR